MLEDALWTGSLNQRDMSAGQEKLTMVTDLQQEDTFSNCTNIWYPINPQWSPQGCQNWLASQLGDEEK